MLTTEYLAYGSNMNLAHLHEWLERLDVPCLGARNPRRAILPGFRIRTNYLTTASLGAANIEPCRGEQVEGVLLQVWQNAVAALRAKEGCPRRYEEIDVEVIIPSMGRKIHAMTYRVTNDHQLPFDLPVSNGYRKLILDGARAARLSVSYQARLKRILRSPAMLDSSLQATAFSIKN